SSSHSSLYGEIMKIVSEILLKQRHDAENNDTITLALRNSKNPEMLAYIMSGSILGAFYWWRQNNYEVPQQDVIDFAKNSIHAVSNHLGHNSVD
ncbi:TetR/AcrR family transcriptional regulator, partial [Limosilactobacillus mucosae]|nr:TetR/AcrR family transcriptional regulator [Limosilactobacillus mucosae]